MWNQNRTENFKKGMQRCKKDPKGLIEMPETDAKNIAPAFVNIVLKITKNGGIQKKKICNWKTGKNPNWLDSNCITAKKEMKRQTT